MTDEKKADIPDQPTIISWAEFLQEQPPGSVVAVSDCVSRKSYSYGVYNELRAPDLQLFCPEPTCNAVMFFTAKNEGARVDSEEWCKTYLTYRCRNCRKYSKMFAVAVKAKDDELVCDAFKFGELPNFGPPVPSRVLRLIQSDRELFLSGRRSENQGLGIGAFTYYRRVVENQWNRLIDEIIKVANAVGVSADAVSAIAAFKDQQQFSKAVKELKHGIPESLLINGHSPLVLLHSALSQGDHDLTDEECLSLATSIRVVLIELADKLSQALKDEKELTDAVSRLLQTHAKKSDPDNSKMGID